MLKLYFHRYIMKVRVVDEELYSLSTLQHIIEVYVMSRIRLVSKTYDTANVSSKFSPDLGSPD